MTSKKNTLWRFLFSLIPGAGEMYMGFLKMGVSIMALFFFIIFAASSFSLGILIIADVIVWFYSFFHVHNLASLSDEEFYSVEDTYLFRFTDFSASQTSLLQNNRSIIAAVLIFIGITSVWRSVWGLLREFLPGIMYDFIWIISYSVPRLCAGIAVIVIGVWMIRGKKKDLTKEEEDFHGKQ